MKRAYLAAVLMFALSGAALAQAGTSAAGQAASHSRTARTQAAPSPSSRMPIRTFVAVPTRGNSGLGRHGQAPAFGYSSPCSTRGISPLVPSAMGCLDPRFTSQFYFPDGRNHGVVNLQPEQSFNYPVYVPYTYAYPVMAAPEPPPPIVEEAEPPAPTIFERRAQAAPVRATASGTAEVQSSSAVNAGASEAQASGARAEAGDETERVPAVLIFRDGHQIEVMNYAIVGQTLYDLGSFVSEKIPLSELNLKATIKANQDRGLEFNVPASAIR